jgi:hypothetical protein
MSPEGKANQIKMPPGPDAPIPKSRWFNTAESAEHHLKWMKQDCHRRQGAFNEEELVAIFNDYTDRRVLRAMNLDNERWLILSRFRNLLESNQRWAETRLAGGDFAVYELMYRCEPSKFINRNRFITAMRNIYGFKISETGGTSDQEVLALVNKVFDAFDREETDEMDWRTWLVMSRILITPLVFLDEHLKWGFCLFASVGSFDSAAGSPVAFQDIRDMFSCLTHRDYRPELLRAVDGAWTELMDKNLPINMAAKKAAREGKSNFQVKMTLSDFEWLMKLPQLAQYVCHGEPYGTRDGGTWTLQIEERFEHDFLLKIVKAERRELYALRKCDDFVKQKNTRIRKYFLLTWCRYVVRRQRCRYLLAESVVRFHVSSLGEAVQHWAEMVIWGMRLEQIQRIVRGFLARRQGKFLIKLHQLATIVQARARCNTAGKAYRLRVQKRIWASVTIQKNIRGNLSRRFVAVKLEAFIAKEMHKLNRKRFEWENRVKTKAILKLQRNWRALVVWREKEAARIKKENEERTLQAFEDHKKEEIRSRNTYEQGLEKWYREYAEEMRKTTMYEEFTGAEKAKILAYRKAKDMDREKQKRDAEIARKEREEEVRIEKWNEDWERKEEERVVEHAKYLWRILEAPENPKEKKERHNLKLEVNKRWKEVLKDAEESNLPLELNQAIQVTTDLIIREKAEAQRPVVKEEMKAAAIAYQELKAKEYADKAEKREQSLKRSKNRAATMFQDAWKMYAARETLRTKAKKVFRKEFNPENFQYAWIDQRNDTPYFHKPYAFGPYDIKTKDEWVMMKDAAGIPYYYNPLSMLMHWRQPGGTVDCVDCPRNRENLGENFAKRYCNIHKKPLCLPCWTRAHKNKVKLIDRLKLSWKVIDGGAQDSREGLLTVDMLPDQTEADLRAAGGDKDTVSEAEHDQETRALLKKMGEESAKRKEQMRKVLEEGGTPEQRVNKIKYIERMKNQEHQVENRLDSDTARIGSFAVTRKEWNPRNDLNCVECGEVVAERHCNQCQHFFCASCFDREHGRDAPNWKEMRLHHFQVVERVKSEITDMFSWPEDRKIQPGLSSNDAHKLAVKMLHTEDEESKARLAESSKHLARTLESKTKEGILGPVVPDAVTAYSSISIVKGVKGATFGDLELDRWLSNLLDPLPNKLCTIYTRMLCDVQNGLNCISLRDLITGECCPAIVSAETLVDIGLKPGHARKVFAKVQVHREEQALLLAEKAFYAKESQKAISAATSGSTITKAGPRGRRRVLLSSGGSSLPSAPSLLGGMFGRAKPPAIIDESCSGSGTSSESGQEEQEQEEGQAQEQQAAAAAVEAP